MPSSSNPSSLTSSDRKFFIKAVAASAVLSALLFGGLMLVAQKAILNKVLEQMEGKTPSLQKETRSKDMEDGDEVAPPGRSPVAPAILNSDEY